MNEGLLFAARSAVRALRRAPRFAGAVTALLGIGIGFNTAVFSSLYSLVLKPLPYSNSHRLVALYGANDEKARLSVGWLDLKDWRSQMHSISTVGGCMMRTFGLDQQTVIVVDAGMITEGFFQTLGVVPTLGHAFRPGDQHAAWLTDQLWRSRFSANPAVVGQNLRLNEESFEIAGVLPADFRFTLHGRVPDLFIPLSEKDYGQQRGGGPLFAIARLASGATLLSARAELETVAARLATVWPATNRHFGASIESLHDAMLGNARRPAAILFVAVGLLLLVICANVAALLLARALGRWREVAIRLSVGGNARQILAMFLAEGFALATLGNLAGIVVAVTCLHYAGRFVELQQPSFDLPALLFTIFITAGVTLLFGLAPALAMAKMDLNQVMQSGSLGRQARTGTRLRSGLVIAQVVLSTVLLVNSGLLLRSLWNVVTTDPGFSSTRLISFGIGLPEARYNTDEKLSHFHENLIAKLRTLPSVEEAAGGTSLPLVSKGWRTTLWRADQPKPQQLRPVEAAGASPDYFHILKIPILAGRPFTADDRIGRPAVCIVNRTLAQTFFSDASPIGLHIQIGFRSDSYPRGTVWEIVGVVGDTRQDRMEQPPAPELFLSTNQLGPEGFAYLLRTPLTAASLTTAIRDTVRAMDPLLEEVRPRDMSERVAATYTDRKMFLALIGSFALVALLLNGLGIYGVVSYGVIERTREIGIRTALGAQASHSIALVMNHGLRLIVAGLAIGLASAWAASRAIESQLFNVVRTDVPTIIAAVTLITITALIASFTPARRATKIDPAEALRHQ